MEELPEPLDAADTSAYELLQVSPRACAEVIHAAYRALARGYHPDVSADPRAALRMQQLNAAYDLLSDPVRRAQYDLELARAERLSAGATRRPANEPPPPWSDAAPPRAGHQVPWLGIVLGAAIIGILLFGSVCLWVLADAADEPAYSGRPVDLGMPISGENVPWRSPLDTLAAPRPPR